MGDWEDDMSPGDSFDDPESCECALVFDRDECSTCGHDLACIDAYCIDENHLERLAKFCDCHSGDKVDECSDCYHDLGCTLSDCDNEEHDRVQTYGNPKLCICLPGLQDPECSNCGHSIVCLQDECGECYEPDHSHFFTFFNHPEGCECAEFKDPIPCDSCNHDLNCPENDAYCRVHHKTEPASGTKVFSEANSAQAREASDVEAIPSNPSKRGSYWTRAEDESLASHYLGGASDSEISQLLGRSGRAIQSRLVKICFEANGITIQQNLTHPREAMARWAATEDHLLEGLSSTKVELSTISKTLERSELAVAFRLVAKRIAKPGNLDLIFYNEQRVLNFFQENADWSVAQYLQLREGFRMGKDIRNLAAKSGKSEMSCFAVLYTMGELTNFELDVALKSAAGNAASQNDA
jgi:hypothetical protein